MIVAVRAADNDGEEPVGLTDDRDPESLSVGRPDADDGRVPFGAADHGHGCAAARVSGDRDVDTGSVGGGIR